MARKKDFRPGVSIWVDADGERLFLGLATSGVLDGRVSVQLYATDKPVLRDYRDLTVDAPPRPQALVRMALEHLIGGRRPFTADEVWDMLAHYDGVSSGEHGPLLGKIVQDCRPRMRIVTWQVTEASAPHSRAVPVWQPVTSRAKRSAA